ncbi:MAG: hypothetical protein IJN52_05180 [Bacteroidales bacterium]|nr:hypothetical protein [Bacteroidales bacterium]
MKKVILSLLAVSMILFSNCTQKEYESPVIEKSLELTAIMEGETQTRSEVTDNGYFTWAEGDEILIFSGESSQKGTLSDGAGTPVAKFTYEEEIEADAYAYAVYPHNTKHSLDNGTLTVKMPAVYELGKNTSNTNAIMLAVSQSEEADFKFQHLGAVIRFNFKNVPAGVDKLVLSLGGKKINGEFVVDTENLTISTADTDVEEEKSITLEFEALTAASNLKLYVPVPVGEYKGMAACLKAGEETVWEYSSDNASNNINRRDLKLATVQITEGLAGAGTEANPYLIADLSDLIAFRDHVNEEGTKYNAEGVYVALTDDIDMSSVDWSVNIGDDCNTTFDGIFDGRNHVIRNLNSVETAAKADEYFCTGLFGAIYGPAVVKNLTIENVDINAGEFTGNNAGAVVGFAYKSTGSIENVKVTGDININAAGITGTGAVVGYAYSSKLNLLNCTVKGNEGSKIVGAAYVGGLIGYSTMDVLVGNTVSNIDVTATSCCAGGVAGIMLAGGQASNNTVTDVNLISTHENWHNSAAVVVGAITGKVNVAGTEFDNVTANGSATTSIVGSAHADKPTTPVAKVQASVENDFYVTFAEALADATNEQTITLWSDIVMSETLTIAKDNVLSLDLNGYDVSYAVDNDGKASAIFSNNGTLNLSNNADSESVISFVASDPDLEKIPSYATNTISNYGTLTIGKNVVVTNTSDGGASYAVDNHAFFTLNGGTLLGNRCALRIAKFNPSTVVFTMVDGLIKAGTPAWIHLPGSDSSVAPSITVVIEGGRMETTKETSADNNIFYSYSYGNSHANTTINISGGEFIGGTVSIGSGYKGDAPEMNITGGKFDYDVVQWLENDEYKVLYEANNN